MAQWLNCSMAKLYNLTIWQFHIITYPPVTELHE